MLNDIALINNELVTTQRNLAKKNAEIQKMNIELKALNADLEQFTLIASHDLQEPLRMITGFMELLKIRYSQSLDEKANSYIDFALNGGKRMKTLIKNLLELSKVGRDLGIREQVVIGDIVTEVQQNLARLIEERKASITIGSGLPTLLIFRSGISQLFQNLIGNAIKFSEPTREPVISITAIPDNGYWLFKIADNGIGIDPDNKHIFEIFGRSDTQAAYDGNGIGLAICKKVVESHGGRIWVEAQQGPGSTFCFTLLKEG